MGPIDSFLANFSPIDQPMDDTVVSYLVKLGMTEHEASFWVRHRRSAVNCGGWSRHRFLTKHGQPLASASLVKPVHCTQEGLLVGFVDTPAPLNYPMSEAVLTFCFGDATALGASQIRVEVKDSELQLRKCLEKQGCQMVFEERQYVVKLSSRLRGQYTPCRSLEFQSLDSLAKTGRLTEVVDFVTKYYEDIPHSYPISAVSQFVSLEILDPTTINSASVSASCEGRICGLILCSDLEGDGITADIIYLLVARELRSRGVGSAIRHKAFQRLVSLGFRRVRTMTAATNAPVVASYQHWVPEAAAIFTYAKSL